MPWEHTNKWNTFYIQEYGMYCQSWYKSIGKRKIDCADLAIQLVSDYAAGNGLPVKLSSGYELFISWDYKGSKNKFIKKSQKAVMAKHLNIPINTIKIFNAPKPGDLIVSKGHIQIITSFNEKNIKIVQGNLTNGLGISSSGLEYDKNKPTKAQVGFYYDINYSKYQRLGNSKVSHNLLNGTEFRRWNFKAWNVK